MLLAAGLLGFLASRSVDTAFAAPCATPGTDGPAGTLTGIVNTYYPGTANAAAGATSISVGTSRGAATAIAAGDLLLVIQMQDAAINSTDTDSYGDGVAGGTASGSTSVNNSGKFEYVQATGAVTAGAVGITGAGAGSGLVNSYVNAAATATQGQRRFQVIRVPQYSTATLGSGLTVAAWNGTTGGILAVDVTGTLALAGATVDVTGLGFRGGGARQLTGAGGGSNTAYRSLATAAYHAQKGEGIAGTPRYVRNGSAAATDTGVEGYPNGSSARGAPGNAGGGGTDGNPATNDQNSGGGGGANGGTGGQGGNTWSSNLARGGYGGTAFAGSVSQLVLGGGGGAGTRNNTPSVAAASAGGNGGGMVMLRAGNLSGTGTITADGQTGVLPENDAGGGGGAGGSVMVLSAGGGTGGLTVNARGAVGGDGEQATSGAHGPGGGGGGGVVVLSGAAAGVNVGGGAAGDTNNGSGTFIPYGATAGTSGSSTTSATLPGVPGTSAGTECTPQLTVTKTTSTPVVVDSGSGGTATYTITVANAAGRAAATSTSISDALPTGFTFASTTTVTLAGGATRPSTTNPSVGSSTPAWGSFTIPGGGQVQIAFTTAVAAGTTPATYQNPATATYTDPARATAGGTTSASYNPASSTGEDVQVRLPIANVGVTKTVSNATPALNTNVTFTVTVTNGGPELARAVSVADTLPAGLTFVSATPSVGTYNSGTGVWTVGNLNNGASATLSLVATVTTHTLLTNTATASTTSTDPTPANNAASATVNVPDANLAVTKSVSNATPAINTNVTFTVTVTNNGPDAASGVTVADALPAGLTFVSATPSVGSYNSGTGCVDGGEPRQRRVGDAVARRDGHHAHAADEHRDGVGDDLRPDACEQRGVGDGERPRREPRRDEVGEQRDACGRVERDVHGDREQRRSEHGVGDVGGGSAAGGPDVRVGHPLHGVLQLGHGCVDGGEPRQRRVGDAVAGRDGHHAHVDHQHGDGVHVDLRPDLRQRLGQRVGQRARREPGRDEVREQRDPGDQQQRDVHGDGEQRRPGRLVGGVGGGCAPRGPDVRVGDTRRWASTTRARVCGRWGTSPTARRRRCRSSRRSPRTRS